MFQPIFCGLGELFFFPGYRRRIGAKRAESRGACGCLVWIMCPVRSLLKSGVRSAFVAPHESGFPAMACHLLTTLFLLRHGYKRVSPQPWCSAAGLPRDSFFLIRAHCWHPVSMGIIAEQLTLPCQCMRVLVLPVHRHVSPADSACGEAIRLSEVAGWEHDHVPKLRQMSEQRRRNIFGPRSS